MQRSSYAPAPAHSPPLHHPVPQHVSTVPMMRSPPPLMPQQHQPASTYGGMYNSQGSNGGGSFAPNFGGFMNDQTAQMGFQIGKSAVMAGQDYVDQNVGIQEATHFQVDWVGANSTVSCRSTATSQFRPLNTTSTSQTHMFSPNSPSYSFPGDISPGHGNNACHPTAEKASSHHAKT